MRASCGGPLHRGTQPAVSLQIRRLEEILGARLLRFRGRALRLTDAGIALGPYARQMLRINDDIIGHFQNEALSGWIRVGLPSDFANDFLLDAVTSFAAAQVKALVNMVMNINTAGLAEGLGLADAMGLDLKMVCEIFAQTGANSRVHSGDFEIRVDAAGTVE